MKSREKVSREKCRRGEMSLGRSVVQSKNIVGFHLLQVTDTSPAVMIIGGNYHWSDCYWGRKDIQYIENGWTSKLLKKLIDCLLYF